MSDAQTTDYATPHGEQHTVSYRAYVNVWLALIVLTGITVSASYINFGNVGTFTAILIATVKATLVLLYFMHLRYDKPFFTFMILAVLITYGIFVGLTFSDYWYR